VPVVSGREVDDAGVCSDHEVGLKAEKHMTSGPVLCTEARFRSSPPPDSLGNFGNEVQLRLLV
jgi:hypothetical protein